MQRDDGLPFLQKISSVAAGKLWDAEDAKLELWDYDTARQLVWAAQVLQRELSTERSSQPLKDRVAAVHSDFAEIEQLFVLDLIKGRKTQQLLPGGGKGRQVQEINLEETLPVIAKYDAIIFRDKTQALANKLSAK